MANDSTRTSTTSTRRVGMPPRMPIIDVVLEGRLAAGEEGEGKEEQGRGVEEKGEEKEKVVEIGKEIGMEIGMEIEKGVERDMEKDALLLGVPSRSPSRQSRRTRTWTSDRRCLEDSHACVLARRRTHLQVRDRQCQPEGGAAAAGRRRRHVQGARTVASARRQRRRPGKGSCSGSRTAVGADPVRAVRTASGGAAGGNPQGTESVLRQARRAGGCVPAPRCRVLVSRALT